MNKYSEVGRLCENMHGFYSYYHPLTVTSSGIYVALVGIPSHAVLLPALAESMAYTSLSVIDSQIPWQGMDVEEKVTLL